MQEASAPRSDPLVELEAIYRSAPVGLCVLDRDLRFVRINERLAAMNGLPAEAHIGRTVREIVPDIADQGFFDGSPCHRETDSAGLQVLQCGDPTGTGTGGAPWG